MILRRLVGRRCAFRAETHFLVGILPDQNSIVNGFLAYFVEERLRVFCRFEKRQLGCRTPKNAWRPELTGWVMSLLSAAFWGGLLWLGLRASRPGVGRILVRLAFAF